MELVDDLYYKVYGKYIIEDSSIDEGLIGGNKSEEAEDDGGDEDNKKLVADIICGNKLEEAPCVSSKNDYKEYIKLYISKIVAKVAETDQERADFLKTNLKDKFVMPMLKNFKNVRIYASSGDEFDLEGNMIHFEQDGGDGNQAEGVKCWISVLKDGLYEEKC